MDTTDELGIVHPHAAMPGVLTTVTSARRFARLQELEHAGPTQYVVRAVIGSHIPLVGSLASLVALAPETSLAVNAPPLAMFLHRGGTDAVYVDLEAREDGSLTAIAVEVDADSPMVAFLGARSTVNQLLDVLMRGHWLPLVIVRLDLYTDKNLEPIAHELHAPFAGSLSIGPIGGIHQHPLFAELEALAREGILSTSPFYRLLCAYRLYEGAGALRTKLREMSKELGVVRTVDEMYKKLKEARNMVAHFLLDGEGASPLHTSDGLSYRAYSSAAAVLLHYGAGKFVALFHYFQRHLSSKVARGSVYPMLDQRERYRVVVRASPLG